MGAPRSPPPTSARSRAAASRAQSSGRVFQTCKRKQRGIKKGGEGGTGGLWWWWWGSRQTSPGPAHHAEGGTGRAPSSAQLGSSGKGREGKREGKKGRGGLPSPRPASPQLHPRPDPRRHPPAPGPAPPRPARPHSRPLPCPRAPQRGFGAPRGSPAARRPPPQVTGTAPSSGTRGGPCVGTPLAAREAGAQRGFFHKNRWKWGFVPK